jgi:hypothetical protein
VAAKGEDNVGRETAGRAGAHVRSGGNVVTRALESSVDWSEVDDRSGWWLMAREDNIYIVCTPPQFPEHIQTQVRVSRISRPRTAAEQ